jgi:prophage maintenance system killer protein
MDTSDYRDKPYCEFLQVKAELEKEIVELNKAKLEVSRKLNDKYKLKKELNEYEMKFYYEPVDGMFKG